MVIFDQVSRHGSTHSSCGNSGTGTSGHTPPSLETPQIQPKRRRNQGVALLTQRRNILIPRCQAAGIAYRQILLQDGSDPLPEVRPPLLLDTTDLPLSRLIAVLVAAQRRVLTTLALVNPADTRLLRLLPLCSAVRLIASDATDLARLKPFLRHLADHPPRRPVRPPVWIGLPTPPQLTSPLPPLLLSILQSLLEQHDHDAVADACGVSRATLMRLLAGTRMAVGLPNGAAARFRPPVLAMAILAALAEHDLPLN